MKYERQCRVFPNKTYNELERDEVKYLFDVLADNTIDNIVNETGYGRDFVRKTISEYINKTEDSVLAEAS